MRLRILDLAAADLEEGFRFYERQEEGVGNYFLETLLSLREFIGRSLDITVCYRNGSRSQSTTKSKETWQACGASLIAGEIHHG